MPVIYFPKKTAPLPCFFLCVCVFVRLGPLVARAAMYTAGVVGGLSLTAACAPSGKYLNMSGPLTLGLGVVFVASLGKLLSTFAWR